MEAALGALLGGTVSDLVQLSGGASRQTWAFTLTPSSGGAAMPSILQRGTSGADVPSLGIDVQARLMQLAGDAGVPVPRVLAHGSDDSALGGPYVVMSSVAGETIARRILRDDAYATARPRIVAQCGAALAALHRVDVALLPPLPQEDPLLLWRRLLDRSGEPHPAFEIAFRWLEAHRPAPRGPVLVHGDFRLGNLIVDSSGLAAVLDWELAHAGDPLEDLGWLCVKAWRFGEALPVAGLGSYDELIAAYESAGGIPVDRAALHWWETFGTLRWGVICILQAAKHLSGAQRSVELATIGRRVCENEWDVLDCLDRAHA